MTRSGSTGPATNIASTVEVETPDGVEIGIRRRGGHIRTAATAAAGAPAPRATPFMSTSAAGKNLVALLAHVDEGTIDLDGINYVALRAYTAASGVRVSFNQMSQLSGAVPVNGALIPVLVSFADPANPGSARDCIGRRCRRGAGGGIPPPGA